MWMKKAPAIMASEQVRLALSQKVMYVGLRLRLAVVLLQCPVFSAAASAPSVSA